MRHERGVTKPVNLFHGHGTGGQHRFRPHDDLRIIRIKFHHIERVGQAADAKATALPDGVVDHPIMLRQHIAVGVDDIAGVGGFGAQFADHRGVVAIRDKADILTVGLVRHA